MKKVYVVWVTDTTLSVVRPQIEFVADSYDLAKEFLEYNGFEENNDDGRFYSSDGRTAGIDEIGVDKK